MDALGRPAESRGEPGGHGRHLLRRVHARGHRHAPRRARRARPPLRARFAFVLEAARPAGTGGGQLQEPVLGERMDLVIQMWRFLGARRKFWLLPIIIVSVLIGGLLVLAQGSVVAPFIYTLF